MKEKCNNAYNLNAFTKNIIYERTDYQLMLTDYVKGTLDILKNLFNNVSINKRPLHYNDGDDKFFVRINDEWVSDTESNYMSNVDEISLNDNNSLFRAISNIDDGKYAYLYSNYFTDPFFMQYYKKMTDDLSNNAYKKILFSEVMKLVTLDSKEI